MLLSTPKRGTINSSQILISTNIFQYKYENKQKINLKCHVLITCQKHMVKH